MALPVLSRTRDLAMWDPFRELDEPADRVDSRWEAGLAGRVRPMGAAGGGSARASCAGARDGSVASGTPSRCPARWTRGTWSRPRRRSTWSTR
jgi:hypothetical protein